MAMSGWLRSEVLRGEAVFFSISWRIGGPRPDEAAAGSAATDALAVRIAGCSSSQEEGQLLLLRWQCALLAALPQEELASDALASMNES